MAKALTRRFPGKEIHIIVNNSSSHKHKVVPAYVNKRRRLQMHLLSNVTPRSIRHANCHVDVVVPLARCSLLPCGVDTRTHRDVCFRRKYGLASSKPCQDAAQECTGATPSNGTWRGGVLVPDGVRRTAFSPERAMVAFMSQSLHGMWRYRRSCTEHICYT